MIADLESRDKARRRLDANIVVEAGAGTGKTTLLTDRLVFLLLAGGPEGRGIDIRRLVALTFTEKAAGEIKLRLTTKLSDLLSALDGRTLPEARRRAAEGLLEELGQHFHRTDAQVRAAVDAALLHMDRSNISTIHHFASMLLRLYPLESRVDPNFEVDTGTSFEELFLAEWALWLDTELGPEPPRKDLWLEVLPLAPLADIERLARVLCQEGATQGSIGTTRPMIEEIKRFAAEFAALREGKPPPKGPSKILDSIRDVSAHLNELARALDGANPLPAQRPHREFGPKTWPKAWEGLPGRETYERGCRLAQETGAVAEGLVRAAVPLVLPFANMFKDRYVRRGLINFEGLLTRARALVRDHRDVRRALKARFDALLIDEFQDTDPLQGEILLFLAEAQGSHAREWRDIQFAPGKMFLVGDPKQSIYRFRGADIRAYDRFTGLLLAQGAEKCDLQTNFRSRSALVGAVNAVFETLMRRKEGYQPAYLPILPGPNSEGEKDAAAIELVAVAKAEDEGAPTSVSLAAEARWIAEWIATHCAAAGDSDAPADRHAYRDVALLFRTFTPLHHYLDALKERGIPYVVEADRYFYGTQEVIDFVNLLRVLDDPSDRVSYVGLLRSPLMGLPDREIHALARVDGLTYGDDAWEKTSLAADSRRRLASFVAFLRRMRERAGREPLGDFVAALLRDSFLLEVCATVYQHEQTLANLLKFGRLAAEAGDARGATLKEFIRTLVREMAEIPREGESPLADEHLDAVRLLTVHKSKGLEFPVVILPNVGGKKGGAPEKPSHLVDWSAGTVGLRLPQAKAADVAMALLEEDERAREEHEQVRLLYVALTRARDKMILVGKADPGPSSFAALLRPAGLWPGEEPVESLSLDGQDVPVHVLQPEEARRAARTPAAAARGVPEPAVLAKTWGERYARRDALEAREVFTHPTAYLAEKRQKSQEKPRASLLPDMGSLIGQVCHRVLEGWDFRRGGDLANGGTLVDRVERAAQRLAPAYPGADWDAIRRESSAVLESFLHTPAASRLAKAKVLGREVPFVLGRDGQVLRGTIDVLYRHGRKLWVADYKTHQVAAEDMAAEARTYELQGRAYADAVRQALGEECHFQVIFLRGGGVVDLF